MNGANEAAESAELTLTLPKLINRQNKYQAGILLFSYAAAIYLASNHFPIFPPQLLPMTLIDHQVPFLPNTIWLYVSEWLFFTMVYVYCRDMENLNKYVYSFAALQTVSVMIFVLWPTTYPRDQFPLPEDMNALTYYAFLFIRNADTPGNCAPSLHVSSVFLSAFIYLNEQREKFLPFLVWAVLIALSTLTTKQHYLFDLVTGFMLAIIVFWFFHRYLGYREPQLDQAKR